MKNTWKLIGVILGILAVKIVSAQTQPDSLYQEQYRPQLHFSPKAHWTNDPNGMVYFKGIYHLFFQYYPKGTTWGPMHWGHAESPDMIHWKEMPIALYPDSLGYIFSGSAVVDSGNTSGFGRDGKIPLVAIFTHHDPKGEKAGSNTFQNESIAYSLDNGNTWTKYAGNPVLKNPGIRDFRDPKVRWYAAGKKWVMTLATGDHITFFSSPNLKDWKKESEFGKALGAHGGVWECPDLSPMQLNGETWWILIVNVNPGGPNGGSATQYFVGHFDGNRFAAMDDQTRWLDYGPDEYAGITWSNTGDRKIFLGWMSNWIYANQVPTVKWRNAMTIPRELSLEKINGELRLASEPVKELNRLKVNSGVARGNLYPDIPRQFLFNLNETGIADYSIILSNDAGERLLIGYDKIKKEYFIDRSHSGKTDFNREFSKVAYAPRFSIAASSDLKLVVDQSSVELFADGGATVMTGIFFPGKPYTKLEVKAGDGNIKTRLIPLASIW